MGIFDFLFSDETAETVKDSISERNAPDFFGSYLRATQDTALFTPKFLAEQDLADVYKSDQLARKIVEMLPQDTVKQGYKIEGDESGDVKAELKKIDALNSVVKANVYARLFGGAIIVMNIADGRSIEEAAGAGEIISLHVYSIARLYALSSADIVTDSDSDYYNQIERFTINKSDGNAFTVHASRCLIFHGDMASDYALNDEYKNVYFGYSCLQGVYQNLQAMSMLNSAVQYSSKEHQFMIYKIPELMKVLAMEGGEAKLRKRLDMMLKYKSVANGIVIDKEEDIERPELKFSGLDRIYDRQMILIAAATVYPVTKLFKRSPAGMNSSGAGDEAIYYDACRAYAESNFRPQLQKIVDIMFADKDYSIEINDPYPVSEKEKLEIKKLQAEIDKIEIEAGIISAEEIAEKRHGE